MLEGQYFRLLTLSVDLLGRIWIGLALGIAVIGLNVHFFGGALGDQLFTSMTSSSTLGWKFSWEIYWTGGARCRGTSLMVATSGFFTKSSLSWIGLTCVFLRRRPRCCLASVSIALVHSFK